MVRLLLKIQRYFRRKPVRFLSFLLFYLVAGSLVYLHTGLSSNGSAAARNLLVSERAIGVPSSEVGPSLGLMRRVFKDTHRSPRWHRPPWRKENGGEASEQGGQERGHSSSVSQGVNHRSTKDLDDGRAKYVGCYADNTQNRALRGVSFFDYKKMTVFRCQDNCAESITKQGKRFKWTSVWLSETSVGVQCMKMPSLLFLARQLLDSHGVSLECQDIHHLPLEVFSLHLFPGAAGSEVECRLCTNCR